MKSGESRTVLPFGQHAALRSRDHRPEEPRGLAPTRSRPGGLTERFRVTLGSSPSVAADPDRPAADLREPRRKMPTTSVRRRISRFSRSWLGRPGARCRPCSRSVSPGRPPNRTCPFPGIRLSTGSCRWGRAGFGCRPWRCDASPVAVAADRHLAGVEQCRIAVRGPPSGQIAASDPLPVRTAVFAADPEQHPAPGEAA